MLICKKWIIFVNSIEFVRLRSFKFEESITIRSISNSFGKFVVDCQKKNVTILMIMIRLYVLQWYIPIDLQSTKCYLFSIMNRIRRRSLRISNPTIKCIDLRFVQTSSLLFFWSKHIPWWCLSCPPLLLDWKKDFLAWWWSVGCKNTRMYGSWIIPNAYILLARNKSKISNPLLFTYSRNS